ncbi:hypothetical protein D0Z00_004112 [Geotrichum galactomycetum]|uniref:Uncharacterized protein n=1 Tax=Geotrichum galactomycetum TaxID=27317 RepID=A0ACB6UZB6_9ASCO|nr:hypothetical protein D0Z00_004112 [Geotrichum candidum]
MPINQPSGQIKLTNVSMVRMRKGQVASQEDLKAAFNTTEVNKVILEILNKGELQVGGKERQQQASQIRAETLQVVAAKCVNPTTKRPYPVTIIEKAVAELGFNFVSNKPAKSQALEVIRLLVAQQVIPIVRARMKVRIMVDKDDKVSKYKASIKELFVEVEDEESGKNNWELVGFIDPGTFRKLDELVRTESKGKASMEVLDTAAIQQGDQSF